MHIKRSGEMISQTLKHTFLQSVSPKQGLIRCWESCAFGPTAPMSTLGNGVYQTRPEADLGEGATPGG